jgi:hypothetical protein
MSTTPPSRLLRARAPISPLNHVSIDLAGASIDARRASIGAAFAPVVQAFAPVEQKEQAIEAIEQVIATNLQSIEWKYDPIETASTSCGPNRTFGVEACSFSEENYFLIDTRWKLSHRKVHSIEDGESFVETRCSLVEEKWSLVDTIDSFSTTK